VVEDIGPAVPSPLDGRSKFGSSGISGYDDEGPTEIRKSGSEESRKGTEEPFRVFFDPSVSCFL